MSTVGGQDSQDSTGPATGSVSVCMATYNGARFVAEQLDSILAQLGPHDEVVVVDDASSDATVETVQQFGDSRIRLIAAPANRGHVASFEQAIAEARGTYVLLSDQDDLWPAGRVGAMVEALRGSVAVAGNQEEFPLARPVRPARIEPGMTDRPARNLSMLLLGRRAYFGCAMGFRRDLVPALLPFPRHVEAHDHWIAVVANLAGSFAHVDDVLVLRRVHDNNQTPGGRRALPAVLRSRVWMVVSIVQAARRARGLRAATRLS